jgi:hypothetical protein
MFICKYMYFPTWVFCFVFCGNLQRLLYNMSKQGCFFYKFSHHRECNEYSEIWSYYKEKGNTFVKLQYTNFHCYVHLMGFRWVDTDQFLMFIRACGELCKINIQGRIQGGRPPLKLQKNMIFWRIIVIFTRNTKIPQQFSRLPPQLEKIRFFDVKSWFFTQNTPTIFAPPSARRNFFKCAPP